VRNRNDLGAIRYTSKWMVVLIWQQTLAVFTGRIPYGFPVCWGGGELGQVAAEGLVREVESHSDR